jgi:hypothetical protein
MRRSRRVIAVLLHHPRDEFDVVEQIEILRR